MDEHTEILPRLAAYHDGELGTDDVSAVEAHLADCAACRQKLDDWLALDAALKNLPQPEMADQGVLFRALNQIREQEKAATAVTARPTRKRWVYGVMAAAAVFIFALATTLMWQPEPGIQIARTPDRQVEDTSPPARAEESRVEKQDADALEIPEPARDRMMAEAPASERDDQNIAAATRRSLATEESSEVTRDPSVRTAADVAAPILASKDPTAPVPVEAGDSGIPQFSDWSARLFDSLFADVHFRLPAARTPRLVESNLVHAFQAEFVGVGYAVGDLLAQNYDAANTVPNLLTPEPQELSPEMAYLVSNLRMEQTSLLARSDDREMSADMALRMAEVTWRLANLTADRDDVTSAMTAQRLAVKHSPTFAPQSTTRMVRLEALID